MMQARGRTVSPPARSAVAQSARILIVEDEPALLRALQINLRARGYEVATASTGREALAEAALEKFGGDSLAEVVRNRDGFVASLGSTPSAALGLVSE